MYRGLAIAHIAIAILLAPITVFAPPFLVGPAWAIWLGVRLWKSEPGVIRVLRRTHYVFLVLDALLIWYGFVALQAAEESARRGGGLLGGFGVIPIGIGAVLALFSIFTLLLTVREK